MKREQVLLSAAKYALEVLNMLWDDDRVVFDVFMARAVLRVYYLAGGYFKIR